MTWASQLYAIDEPYGVSYSAGQVAS